MKKIFLIVLLLPFIISLLMISELGIDDPISKQVDMSQVTYKEILIIKDLGIVEDLSVQEDLQEKKVQRIKDLSTRKILDMSKIEDLQIKELSLSEQLLSTSIQDIGIANVLIYPPTELRSLSEQLENKDMATTQDMKRQGLY